jgi:LmbE family N-acetylglucosaminyl deacetylase
VSALEPSVFARGARPLQRLLAELGLAPRSPGAAGMRALVVAAHPDDETVGASWLLMHARDVYVLHVTDGAPHDRRYWPRAAPATREDYAALRARELSGALAHAGLPRSRCACLGVPDQAATETLVPLVLGILRVVRSLSPALLVAHPYEGGHPDHDAAAFAAHAALARLAREGGAPPQLLEMTSYHRGPSGLETGAFLPGRRGSRVAERRLSLWQRRRKARMLACFASQAEVLAPFPLAVERYRRAPAYDFSAPPHAGALHFEALGWPQRGADFCRNAVRALEQLGLRDERALARGSVPC